MRRAAASLAAALTLASTACQGPPESSGPRGSELANALLAVHELPGRGWSVVGTTDRTPDTRRERNPLTEAKGAEPKCAAALEDLSASDTAAPVGFARAVYRGSDQQNGRDLNLTLESRPDANRRSQAITAFVSACTGTLRTRAGDQDVQLRIRPVDDSVPGAVGYTVTYDTAGLQDFFDTIVVTRGDVSISASLTGPDSAKNRAVLKPVVTKAAAKLDAAQAG